MLLSGNTEHDIAYEGFEKPTPFVAVYGVDGESLFNGT